MFPGNVLLVSVTLSLCGVFTSYAQCEPSVLVIGAGPAGIAAASRLVGSNFVKVKVFEAENRIGGRIETNWYRDAYTDIGAGFCHGEKGNIVYSMVKKYNVLRHGNFTFKLIYSDGKYIDDDVATELTNFAGQIDGTQYQYTEEQCGSYASVGECFQKQ